MKKSILTFISLCLACLTSCGSVGSSPSSSQSPSTVQEKEDHTIVVDSSLDHGSIRASKGKAKEGEIIALSITPQTNYYLESIHVTNTQQNEIDLTDDYHFVMPNSDVYITADFEMNNYFVLDFYDEESLSNLTSNGVIDNATNAKTILEKFPEDMIESVDNVTGTGLPKRGGLGLGSGSGTGGMTFHFNELYQITKVTINAIRWAASEGNIEVNNKEWDEGDFSETVSTDGVKDENSLLIWNLEFSTNTIKVMVPSAKQRVIIFSIRFEFELRLKTQVTTSADITKGRIELETTGYDEGEAVKFNVISAAGYELEKLTVKTESGNEIVPQDNSFKMPNEPVNIDAKFKPIDGVFTACFYDEKTINDKETNGELVTFENINEYFNGNLESIDNVTRVNKGKRGGLGFGSSSSLGSVHFVFKESFQFTKVLITAVKWASNDEYLTANGLQNGLQLRGESNSYDCEYVVEYDFIQPTHELTLSTSNEAKKHRVVVYAISFFYEEPNQVYDNLKDLNILAIGDSIFAGSTLGPSATWIERMARLYNQNFYNDSISGTCVASMDPKDSTTNRSSKSMVDRYEDSLLDYQAKNPGVSPEIIIIEGGRNDNSNHLPLGENDSMDKTTVKGAINTMIKTYHETYPDALIVLIPPWYYTKKTSLGYNNITCGETMQQLVDYYKSKGENYVSTIFACDKDTTGVNLDDPDFRAKYAQTPTDVSHLNVEGQKLVEPFMTKSMSELYAEFLKNK